MIVNTLKNLKPKEFNLFWKQTVITETESYTLLYRIEDLIMYKVHTKLKSIYIVRNQGQTIPDEAIPITKDEYEFLILKYIL